jgi:pimeloyl-ACP methyl ester carboxylesterase
VSEASLAHAVPRGPVRHAVPRERVRHALVVPGLGLLTYLSPLVRSLERRGLHATVLDLPCYDRRSGRATEPTVPAVAEAAAAALLARPASERLVLVGHSTGAQAALRAALQVQDARRLEAVVLAGPTVAPTQRRLDLLALTAGAAYRRDSLRQLTVLPEVLRARLRLVTLLRSAIADRPERSVARLSAPLVLTAGRSDAFAPAWWLDVLASGASRSPAVAVALMDGSHNNPHTHPDDLARLIAGCAVPVR